MNNKTSIAAALAASILAAPLTASAGLFDAIIQNVAKDALSNTVGGAANQMASNAVQPDLSGLGVQNGCYFNLPPAPASLPGLAADVNRNGCVDKNEAAAYLIAVSNAGGSAPAPASGGLMSALVGGAAQQVAGGGGLPISGNALGWVAAQNAVGAAANAVHNNNSQQAAPVAVAMNSQPQSGSDFAGGDVLKGKIGGVKVYADANENANVVYSLSKREEVVYTGAEANGFLRIQTSSGEGWVSKLMVSKN